jgi:hypothetical protein
MWPARNRESWRNLVSFDPTESVIRWGWTQHDKYATRYATAMKDPRWAHLEFVRLRTARQATGFVAALS